MKNLLFVLVFAVTGLSGGLVLADDANSVSTSSLEFTERGVSQSDVGNPVAVDSSADITVELILGLKRTMDACSEAELRDPSIAVYNGVTISRFAGDIMVSRARACFTQGETVGWTLHIMKNGEWATPKNNSFESLEDLVAYVQSM